MNVGLRRDDFDKVDSRTIWPGNKSISTLYKSKVSSFSEEFMKRSLLTKRAPGDVR